MGFLCGMETSIEHGQARLGVATAAVRAVRSESRPDFLEVLRQNWPTIKIPFSKLRTHF